MSEKATEQEIRDQGEAVLRSPVFVSAPRQAALLRYLLEKSLSGEGAVTGYAIGIDVFSRSEDFDPQSDSIVRVMIGRLRSGLDRYYREYGQDDAIRIDVPKGSYKLTFTKTETDDPEPVAQPVFTLRRGLFFVAGALLAGVAVWYAMSHLPKKNLDSYPVIEVRAFENLTRNPENNVMGRSIRNHLAGDINRFPAVKAVLPDDIGTETPKPNYILSGSVLEAVEGFDVIVRLTDVKTTQQVWENRYAEPAKVDNYRRLLRDISETVTNTLLGPAGAVNNLEQTAGANPDNSPFRCYSLFNHLQQAPDYRVLLQTDECLSEAEKLYPNDSLVLTGLAGVNMYASPDVVYPQSRLPGKFSMERARSYAERAIAVDPGNPLAHQYMAMIHWLAGEYEAGEDSAYLAYELNPTNKHALAFLGLLHGMKGDAEKATDYVSRSLENNPDAPGWYRMPMFLDAVMQNDPKVAADYAALLRRTGDPHLNSIELISAQMNGDADGVARFKPLVQARLDAYGVELPMILTRWGAPEPVIAAVQGKMEEAGIVFPTETATSE